jgi:hypothetical protein
MIVVRNESNSDPQLLLANIIQTACNRLSIPLEDTTTITRIGSNLVGCRNDSLVGRYEQAIDRGDRVPLRMSEALQLAKNSHPLQLLRFVHPLVVFGISDGIVFFQCRDKSAESEIGAELRSAQTLPDQDSLWNE